MTLMQLKEYVEALKIGGRVLPNDASLETFQKMVFDHIVQLCDPLNLAIPYQDSDIVRPINEDGPGEWFLKKPRIAKIDADYIDIDSGLETAFVYYMIAFVANDKDKVVFEQKADRMCIEYAVSVLDMGLPKAKEVYELDGFILSVSFDCVGRKYTVDLSYVELLIAYLLGNTVVTGNTKTQMDLYALYLTGGSISPLYLEKLRALDSAVFLYLLYHFAEYTVYPATELEKITTLFDEFKKCSSGSIEIWVAELDKRLALDMEG